MIPSQKCNICGSDQTGVLYDLNPLRVMICNNCKLIFVNPTLAGKEYEEQYFGEEACHFFKDCKFGYSSDSPVIKDYNNVLCTLENELGGKGKILDVGCAMGVFLDVAKKRGWEPFGVEISEYASAYARDKFGLNVITGKLRTANFPNDYFDAVTVQSVLEHLTDPTDLLKEVHRILRQGGILRVYVPNSGSLFYYLVGASFKMSFHRIRKPLFTLYTIHHIPYTVQHYYHFSPNNLKRLPNKAGFEVITLQLQETHIERHIPSKIAQIVLQLVSFLQSRLGMKAMITAFAKKTDKSIQLPC